jgi:hypothetical protein
MTYLLKAKAIFLKKLGPDHPHTKNAQGWIDLFKQPPLWRRCRSAVLIVNEGKT